MNTAFAPGTSVGSLSLGDGDDITMVLQARALRRRLRLLARVLKGLMLLGLFGACAGVALILQGGYPGCRSKQSEAKGNLKALFRALDDHLTERGVYSDDFAALGFTPKAARIRYRYVVTDVVDPAPGREAGFVAWAIADEGDEGLAGDAWCVDNTNNITNLHDVCRGDRW